MKSVKIGTCSWKYDSWKGLVYSDNVGENYLQEYAQQFNTVEIDQWFWSLFENDVVLPKSSTVQEYVKSVPDNFSFAVKIPNSITLTHYYQKDKSKALVPNPGFLSVDLFKEFLQTVEPMKNHLGPLMFQFEYLNREKMPSQIQFQDQFEKFISACPRDYNYGIEIRNPNYLNKRYFEFLNANDLSHVFLQGYYMPSIFPLYASYRTYIKKSTTIRLWSFFRCRTCPGRAGVLLYFF